MATFINVDYEAISLLEQNRHQVDANRINSLEGAEQKQLKEQIQAARQKQRRPVRGRLRPGRREELAATAKPINLIVLELSYDRNDYIPTPDWPFVIPSQPGVYDLSIAIEGVVGTGWSYTVLQEAVTGSPGNNGSFQNQVFWPGEDITNSELPQLGLDTSKRYDFGVIDLTRQLTLEPGVSSRSFDIIVFVQMRSYIPFENRENRDKTPKLSFYPVSIKTGSGYIFGESYNDFPTSLLDLPQLIALGTKNKKTVNIDTEQYFTEEFYPNEAVLKIKIVNSKLSKIEVLI